MRVLLLIVAVCLALFVSPACAVHEVESSGTIVEVNPGKREIYILSEGEKLEYYFNDTTTVSRAGVPVAFDELQVGQQVRVKAKKFGKRLDPIAVEILD